MSAKPEVSNSVQMVTYRVQTELLVVLMWSVLELCKHIVVTSQGPDLWTR